MEQFTSCRRCGLGLVPTCRFGILGSPTARILVVGDLPVFYDGKGQPLPPGTFLEQMLSIMDLDWENACFTTLIKCLPQGGIAPLATEVETCFGWLRQQIALQRPKIIIALGDLVAEALLGEDVKIAQVHGTGVEKNGILIFPTYHPSVLLRNDGLRPDAFGDLVKLRGLLAEKL